MGDLFSFFYQSAKQYPDNNALYVDGKYYRYSELCEHATMVGNLIPAEASTFVALLAHRSLMAFAGVLGILQAGKAFLPLNKNHPPRRWALMISTAGADTIVVEKNLIACLPKLLDKLDKPVTIIIPDAVPGDLVSTDLADYDVRTSYEMEDNLTHLASIQELPPYAYMMFTSGSTGAPKGVPINHRNATTYINNINSLNQFYPEDRFSNTFDPTFDLIVHDMFVCWSNGATLYCIPEEDLFAPGKFIKQHCLTVWFSVPSLANLMNRLKMLKPGAYPDFRLSFFCGEPLYDKLLKKWTEACPASTVKNLYGPAEATISISEHEVDAEKPKVQNGIVSIGRIFTGNTYAIVNENLEAVQTGYTGELLLTGEQITEGYWKALEKNRKAFIKWQKKHWYKTGDLVREDEENDLFFIERKDFQVKIQGYRIEPGEIDYIISEYLQHVGVHTFVREKGKYRQSLISVINEVPDDKAGKASEIKQHCRDNLPSYMVPEKVIFVDDFPLNQNHKTDINKLRKLAENKITS